MVKGPPLADRLGEVTQIRRCILLMQDHLPALAFEFLLGLPGEGKILPVGEAAVALRIVEPDQGRRGFRQRAEALLGLPHRVALPLPLQQVRRLAGRDGVLWQVQRGPLHIVIARRAGVRFLQVAFQDLILPPQPGDFHRETIDRPRGRPRGHREDEWVGTIRFHDDLGGGTVFSHSFSSSFDTFPILALEVRGIT